ncbi:exo-alpha-sialidase [Paenibacillus sp. N3.4]|uniref:exo-alpha-sialidase n=1 Tax=Paenibacillus sp. N3.4 TaxID=2603222 RepID=UPI0016501BF4|nr:exo-alpha-sialidase [Paenibacillus sp. N3.4]
MKQLQRFNLMLSLILMFSLLGTATAGATSNGDIGGIIRTDISPDDTVNHNHGSSMVELHDGTLLAVWFSGDGERDGNVTKLVGARSKDGGNTWTPPFTVYDTLDFPDNNPVIYVDSQYRLWLFYNVIYNGQWVSAQPKFMYADLGTYEYDARSGGNPKWHFPQPIFMNVGDGMVGKGTYSGGIWKYGVKGAEIKYVTPSSVTASTYLDSSKYVEVTSWFNPTDKRYVTDSFVVSMKRKYEQFIQYLETDKPYDDVYNGRTQTIIDSLQNGIYTVTGATYSKYEPPIIKNSIERASGADNDSNTWNPMYRRLGWQTKNKPIEIQYNNKTRLILPLYSDSLAASICVYTDDHGATWKMSDPIVGAGTIQGSLIQLTNGNIRAYFRSGKLDGKNGRLAWHTTYSESSDGGQTWSVNKVDPYLKNDGGFEISKLPNGDWLAATNQETKRGVIDSLQSGHRRSFSLLLSKDEGLTWKSFMIMNDPTFAKETYEYPSVIVDRNGNALMNYSHFIASGSSTNKKMGFVKVGSSDIQPLFDSVISATYGSNMPVPVINNMPGLSLSKSDTTQLSFTLKVAGNTQTDGNLYWSSDNASVATIDNTTGVISAIKAGTALITVVSQKYGTIYKCLVTVTDGV